MIKYRLVSPFVGQHVQLFDSETDCKKSLTHSPYDIASGKEIASKWTYFNTWGWKIEKVKVTIESID